MKSQRRGWEGEINVTEKGEAGGGGMNVTETSEILSSKARAGF